MMILETTKAEPKFKLLRTLSINFMESILCEKSTSRKFLYKGETINLWESSLQNTM